MDYTSGDIETVRWKDLPETVLSHVLRLAPYKRADVKLVCQSWRTAVNASLKSVSIPEGDLDLLHQLTAVQELTVTAAAEGTQDSAVAAGVQRAAQSLAAGFAALHTTPGSSRSQANPWCNAHPSSMQRLRVLNLQHCPQVFRQLAEWQGQQFRAASTTVDASGAGQHSSDSSSGDAPRPGLDRLEELLLTDLENISSDLPILLVGQTQLQHTKNRLVATSSSSATLPPWPLQHLSALHISRCRGVEDMAEVLPQLPALRSFAVSHGNLWELPAAVCDCTAITQIKLQHTHVHCLPGVISKLQKLQVLEVSSCTNLVSLCSGLSCLTELTHLDLSGPNMLFKHSQLITSIRYRLAVGAALRSDRDAASTAYVLNLEAARAYPLPEQQQLGVLTELSSLSSLRRLRLARNRDMRVLPSSVCCLTQLEQLDATSCSLRYLNDELWQCVGLRELLLGDNVLAALSEDIRGLQNLEVLDIGRCSSLWRLPSALLSLPQLRHVVLSNKAVGQNLLERLELRSPNPVDVECDNYDSDSAYDAWGDEDPGDSDAEA